MLGVNRDLASAGRAKPFLPTGFQKFGDGGFPLAFASHSRLLSSLLFEDGRGNPHRRRSIGVATSECRGLTMAIVTKKLEIVDTVVAVDSIDMVENQNHRLVVPHSFNTTPFAFIRKDFVFYDQSFQDASTASGVFDENIIVINEP